MQSKIKNPNLIVKNGFYLFIRLLFVMAIAFYTTRLTLQMLGDEDYGINNIVGGLISIFAMVSMPITGALQRFYNVEFTKQEIAPNVVFCTSLRIIFYLAIGMTIIYETIGLYFVNNVLNYPEERTFVVNVIFQLTIIATILNLFTLSYSSLLYAKEDMGIPATVEIIGSMLKLLMLFSIPYVSMDVLIAYSVIILLISVIQLSIYVIYCKSKYDEAVWTKIKDDNLQKDILRFAGWSSINAAAGISLTYLSNIFINVFGGVLYNTAYGISHQLSNAVVSFSSNVMKAVDPQITNATVANQSNYRNQLVLSSIKISLWAVGICYITFEFYGEYLLGLWLDHIPEHVYDFCRLALLNIMFTSIALPLRTIVMATGHIEKLFLHYALMSFIANGLMLLLLWLGWPVITVMYLILLVSVGYFIDSIFIVQSLSSLRVKKVLKSILEITAILSIGWFAYMISYHYISVSIITFLTLVAVIAVLEFILVYFLALNKGEKQFVKNVIKAAKTKI